MWVPDHITGLWRVAISGARSFEDRTLVEKVIDRLIERQVKILVACGDRGCTRGVDSFAHEYVEHRADDVRDYEVYYAEWKRYGKSAGILRNEVMIHDADELIAFIGPDSVGTLDAIHRAVEKGIAHHVYYPGIQEWCSFGPTNKEVAMFEIGNWVRREVDPDEEARKWHLVESIVNDDAITRCGRRMARELDGLELQVSLIIPLTRMIDQPQLCQAGCS